MTEQSDHLIDRALRASATAARGIVGAVAATVLLVVAPAVAQEYPPPQAPGATVLPADEPPAPEPAPEPEPVPVAPEPMPSPSPAPEVPPVGDEEQQAADTAAAEQEDESAVMPAVIAGAVGLFLLLLLAFRRRRKKDGQKAGRTTSKS
jgi:MYXO-CTERM domain-containing protein